MDALWIAIAFIFGLIAKYLRLPPLVGYLVAGFFLSQFPKPSGQALEQISHIGVLLLLFTVGLKLKLRNIFRKDVLGVGGLAVALFALLIAVVGIGWKLCLGGLSMLAISLALSSTVLALKLLEDRKELSTYHGRLVIGILVLQDILAVGLLAVSGGHSPSPWALSLFLVPLVRPIVVWALEKSGHDELLLIFGIGLAIGGAQLALLTGISSEIGALLMGAALAGHPKTSELGKQLWSLKESFLVAFFLQIGLSGLPSVSQLGLVAVILLALSTKSILFFLLFTAFGLRARTAFVSSLALATYSEFALITTSSLVENGVIPNYWQPVMAMAVAISLAIAAPLNQNVHRIFSKLEKRLLRFERQVQHPDEETTQIGLAQWLVVGMGRTGGAAYKMLETRGELVLGLDADENKLERHTGKNRMVAYGDSEDPKLWEFINLEYLKGVLLTLPDLEAKLRALEGLRNRKFQGVIAATSYHLEDDEPLKKAGATMIFRPFAEAGERLAERALNFGNEIRHPTEF